MFFWIHVFRVHVFQGPGFSGSSFSRVQVFQGLEPGSGPRFLGSRSRVWVQVLEVANMRNISLEKSYTKCGEETIT